MRASLLAAPALAGAALLVTVAVWSSSGGTASTVFYARGDINCDGAVDSVDALFILRYVAGLPLSPPDGCSPPNATRPGATAVGDVDCDSDVDASDGLKIERYVAQLPVSQREPCPDIGSFAVTVPSPTPTATPGATPAQSTAAPSPTAPTAAPGDAVLVGAGDIASCASNGDEATADLLDTTEGIVFTAGDNAYESGSQSEYANCYDPGWGRQKARTRPAPGNHEYYTAQAAGYFGYFGAAAGDPAEGWYSYDAGAWHVVVLNANCSQIGGCDAGSPQYQWLSMDLAAHTNKCTLAVWHQPVLTAGPHANDETGMLPLWQVLYDHGADLAVNGHDHNYQRYAPLNRDLSAVDRAGGMREIIVGTGGKNLTNIDPVRAAADPGLEVWADAPGDGDGHDASFGVLKLTLHVSSYDWQFLPVTGETFTESGSASCH